MGRKNKSKTSTASSAKGTGTIPKNQTSGPPLLIELTDQLLKVCSEEPPSGAKLFDEYKELYNIVQSINDLEKDVSLPTTNREEYFEDFMQWLRKNGLTLDGISIAKFDHGEWGLKAEREIKEEQLWLSVPRTLLMSTQTSKSSDVVDVLKTDPISKHLPNVALSLYLLEERLNPGSFWTPYLNILPSEYNTVLYFNPEEMELLKGSPCLEEALKQYRHIVRQYAYYWQFFQRNRESRILRLKNKFTFNSYRWAVSTVMTRQNAIPSPDGIERWISLVPLWDMCNHAQGKFSTDFNLQKGALECYAQRDYGKGDEIVIFYGPRPNSEFFIHNAFVDPENQFDSVAIKLGISKNDPLGGKKGLVLQQLKINPALATTWFCPSLSSAHAYGKIFEGPIRIRNAQLSIAQPALSSEICSNDPFHVTNQPKQLISARLLAFIRVFTMDENDLNECLDSPKQDLASNDCQLKEALNERAWKFLQARLSLLLGAYPTTIQKDESMLADGNFPSYRAKMALLLRLYEKRILQFALEYVNAQCH